jgi:hypothetical protein
MLLGAAEVHFRDAKSKVDLTQELVYLTPITGNSIPVDWDDAMPVDLTVADLTRNPEEAGQYEQLPGPATDPKNYETWRKGFVTYLGRTQTLEMWHSASLEEQSRPGESERAFRIRLQQLTHERRDDVSNGLREKYAPKVRTLQDRIRRAEQAKAREAEQATQQYLQTAISVGSALLGAFLGRKSISSSNVGRATTVARGASRSMKEAKDVARAEENLESLRKQLADLETRFEEELATTVQKIDPVTESFERVTLRPSKGNIQVKLVTLTWVPYFQDAQGHRTAAFA